MQLSRRLAALLNRASAAGTAEGWWRGLRPPQAREPRPDNPADLKDDLSDEHNSPIASIMTATQVDERFKGSR
jgi:hypothetical protein